MLDLNVARRYADALIDVAAEHGAVDRIGADLQTVLGLLDGNGGVLRNALCTPVFSGAERTAVLTQLLPKLGLHALTGNFLLMLDGRGRLSLIDAVATVYSDLADERAGRLAVRVTSASELSPAVRKDLQATLSASSGRSVVLHTSIDEALIGGIVVRMGGKVYDSSIRTRLQQVRRALLDATPSAIAK